MSLFKIKKSPDMYYANSDTPHIKFLDQCPRDGVQILRKVLDNWFENFPESEKLRLRKTFRSVRDIEHIGAFFELYMHEFLRRNNFSVRIHAKDGDEERAKGFLIERSNREISIEATVSTDKSTVTSQKSNINKLTAYIEEKAFVPGFRYAVRNLSIGKDMPPQKLIVSKIKGWVNTLDRSTLRKKYEMARGSNEMPTESFSGNGWHITLEIIPMATNEEDVKENKNSIGVYPIQSGWRRDDQSLHNTLKNKAQHYNKNITKPFIIAVNCWIDHSRIDEIDINNVLFGKEVIRYNFTQNMEVNSYPGREPDGLWFGPNGWRNRHVSGVLIFSNLLTWTIGTSVPTLYLHPFANNPMFIEDLNINCVSWNPKTGKKTEKFLENKDLFDLPPDLF